MGHDKALLPFRGTPLVQSVAREVTLAAGSAVLVGSPDRYGHLGFPVIADAYPGEGPLGGILTALHHSGAGWNLVVACDMPQLTAAWLTGLLEDAEREEGGADALVPAGPSGLLEPLCAVYHRRSLPVLEAAFAAGVRKIAQALGRVRTVVLPVQEVTFFQNVKTSEDWTPYAAE